MVSEQRQNHIVTAGWLSSVLADVPYSAGNKLFMANIPMSVAAFRWYNMAIERPPLPYLDAWYARLCNRPAFK